MPHTKLRTLQDSHGTEVQPARFYRLKPSVQWGIAQAIADETGFPVEAFSARKSYTVKPSQKDGYELRE